MREKLNNKLTRRTTNILLALFMAFWQLAVPVLITKRAGATGGHHNPNEVSYWCSNFDGGVKFDPPNDGTISGITADFTPDSGQKHSVTTTAASGKTITKVVVKGGSWGGNGGFGNQVYAASPFEDMTAPLNTNTPNPNDTYAISHVIVCYDKDDTGKIKVKKLNDKDGDGKKDWNESYLDGWVIRIYDSQWQLTDTVTTDNSSWVYSGNLLLGKYYLCEVEQDGWQQIEPDSGDQANQSGANDEADWCYEVTLDRDGQTRERTFANKLVPKGKIKLIKTVVNDNGGTLGADDFGLTIGGQSVTSGEEVELPAGTQAAINEAGAEGYEFVSITGSGCPAELGGEVTIVANQTITCTITNDDIAPELTIIKHVINNNGGTKVAGDFTMSVTGTNVSDSSFPGEESPGTTVTLDVGSYSVDETKLSGYEATYSADCSGTSALGEKKTCMITNDDQPGKLVLVKTIVNDNGGTATEDNFQVYINQILAKWGINVVDAGSLTASEDTMFGYLPSVWSGDCDEEGNVSLLPGETKTCTITNDDIAPVVHVYKDVTEGSDTETPFDFSISNDGSTSDYSISAGGEITSGNLKAGEAVVGEAVPEGWTQVSADCYDDEENSIGTTFDAEIGRKYYCYFVNEQLGQITVVKDAWPNDAQDFEFKIEKVEVTECGDYVRAQLVVDLPCETTEELVPVDSFPLDDDNDSTLSNSKSQYVKEGVYKITETQVGGWDLDSIDCGKANIISQDESSMTVYVSPGSSVECTFVNKKQFVPRVLGEVTPKAAVTFAVTGESYNWRNSLFGGTIVLGVVAAALPRRKNENKA